MTHTAHTSMARLVSILAILAAAAADKASADVQVPAIISSGMVLQRESAASLWGWATPGETIKATATWPGADAAGVQTKAGEDGRWMLRLPTPNAGGPFQITLQGNNTIVFSDVMIGEVWLCSGQSNMEWSVAQARDGAAEVAAAKFPQIRLFAVENTIAAQPRGDCRGQWSECTPDSVKTFSAVGYFFGRELHKELNVPIGLIAADWGGTVAEAWTSAEALARFPRFAQSLDYLKAMSDPNERARVTAGSKDKWWEGLDAAAGAEGPIPKDWAKPAFDDSSWKTCTLPATWGDADGLKSFDGLVYYRRAFELPAGDPKEMTLELGPIDDYDDVWVNGTSIGATHGENQWNSPRKYTVPASALHAGKNVIAIRVLDSSGPGGINGKPDQMMKLSGPGGLNVALTGEWKFRPGAAASQLPPRTPSADIGPNTPTALFNGMIAPIAPYSIRGMTWYQGESNRGDAKFYAELFPAMIKDWRAHWLRDVRNAGQAPKLPFYFVQIAPFNYGGDKGETAALREAQQKTLATPDTGMVVTLDVGNPSDIHPTDKQTVGHRLALIALAKTYDRKGVACSGPTYSGMTAESGKAHIKFDDAGEGLRPAVGTSPQDLPGFLIAGEDRKFRKAHARIDGQALVVWHDAVAKPLAVRYAWDDAPTATLFGPSGLPAAPFRTDDWDGPMLLADNSDEVKSFRTAEAGFVDLFNGKDLSGWANVNCAPSTWTVGKDESGEGLIVCSGIPTGELRTTRHYENFVLELEWRHLQSGGNAGLFVFSDPLPARGQPFTRAVEVQVMDGAEGDWYTSDGDVFPIHGAKMVPQNGRGNGDRAFPTDRRANSSPLWNHYRVECIDGSLSLAVNGKVVTRGGQCSPRKGYICLESEGTPIHFRHIRIKELPVGSKPASEAEVCALDEGFVPLYTGVDFTGWKHSAAQAGGDHWKAEDWTIQADGGGEDLWSEKSYKDFVLICDWRWTRKPTKAALPVILPSGDAKKTADGKDETVMVDEAGDSGIYLRGSSKSQVNMWCWPIGSGEVYGYRTDAAMPPDVRAGVTPKTNADAPIGQWNRFVITMRGDRLTVALNGKTVIENARLPGVAESGPIALQRHNEPVEFANIFIKELTPDVGSGAK